MYEELIESLRICGAHNGCNGCAYRTKGALNDVCFRLCNDAADAIKELVAENERLNSIIDVFVKEDAE